MTRRHRGSRPSRNTTPEAYHARRQLRGPDRYEGRHLVTPYETSVEATTSRFIDNNPPPELPDTPHAGSTIGFPRAEDEVSSVRTLSVLTMAPGDGMFDHHHFHQLDNMLGEPTWEHPSANYQLSWDDQVQVSMSPVMFSPSYAVSATPIEFDSSQTGPDSSSEYQYQYCLDGAISTPQDRTAEVDISQGRMTRRWSMRARQGSDVEFPGVGPYENDVVPLSTNQPFTIEKDDSGDSSGDTTPVDRDQYVRSCMSGEDGPWSPECPRQT
ncbi:hypothetical protein F5B17DRAFT_434842 [Nemania serpens]|nr:hypothetical protein F5B17DRAFT_434842 [Nemania serpens]